MFVQLSKSSKHTEGRLGTLIVILFAGFFRPSEALSLERNQVVFNKKNVRINLTKSKCNQNGPVEPVFISRLEGPSCPVAILEEWVTKCPSSLYLFPSFSGTDRPWSYDAALKELKSTSTRMGIKKNLTLHSFRGSAATAAIESGCSEAELDRGARWKSSSSKKSYVQNNAKTTENVSSVLRNLYEREIFK